MGKYADDILRDKGLEHPAAQAGLELVYFDVFATDRATINANALARVSIVGGDIPVADGVPDGKSDPGRSKISRFGFSERKYQSRRLDRWRLYKCLWGQPDNYAACGMTIGAEFNSPTYQIRARDVQP